LLPDFKGALNSFYDEKLKGIIETKSQEYKEFLNAKSTEYQTLSKEFIAKSLSYQKALLAVGLGIFILLAIAYFWKE
jgi:hypothetical protein